MGSFDQASIEHASALHWAETIGRRSWVHPTLFWPYSPTFESARQPNRPEIDNANVDAYGYAMAIFEGDVITGLKNAETLYLDYDIAAWLAESSRHRPSMLLEKSLLPVTDGYLWLEKPLGILAYSEVAAKNGRSIGVTALQWSYDPAVEGSNLPDTVRIIPWINFLEIVGDNLAHTATLRHGGIPIGSVSWKIGYEDTVPTNGRGEILPDTFSGEHGGGIRLDALLSCRVPGMTDDSQERLHHDLLRIMSRCVELFGTLLLFMQQSLLVSKRERPARTARKHAERAKLVSPDVQLVMLRRKVYVPKPGELPESREIDWQYRWPVMGHWRKPRRDGVGPQQPIYIASYIKGPEDKPLKPTNEKIYAVVR